MPSFPGISGAVLLLLSQIVLSADPFIVNLVQMGGVGPNSPQIPLVASILAAQASATTYVLACASPSAQPLLCAQYARMTLTEGPATFALSTTTTILAGTSQTVTEKISCTLAGTTSATCTQKVDGFTAPASGSGFDSIQTEPSTFTRSLQFSPIAVTAGANNIPQAPETPASRGSTATSTSQPPTTPSNLSTTRGPSSASASANTLSLSSINTNPGTTTITTTPGALSRTTILTSPPIPKSSEYSLLTPTGSAGVGPRTSSRNTTSTSSKAGGMAVGAPAAGILGALMAVFAL